MARKLEEKKHLGRHRNRWHNNKINFKGTMWEATDRIKTCSGSCGHGHILRDSMKRRVIILPFRAYIVFVLEFFKFQ
jgi:hypothetical protein